MYSSWFHMWTVVVDLYLKYNAFYRTCFSNTVPCLDLAVTGESGGGGGKRGDEV